ncbi:vacuolar fusion protein CCZ1 homolog B isoform X2 [Amborella trichopoda]|uniref:vacuolar fusion protein CCZ1 homolog B isoform X2 n=1 Tax=Amborella trichopoda TaxID=13333 RepID=UPI0005D38CE4|nr:vacuolar fusion protein CCZ1 homolog B isoform X2 [Amborella trichopoda]|eukprot:XP_011629376.1 vacuolar fusion protein CCZ1 homolog B isoform X2 [Amborella trichopoda]
MMGLSSPVPVGEGFQFCVFDLRRGQHEGQELDKILFFFPIDSPLPLQLSVIGLSEGLITFTRIFSPDAACEVIEAERHSHTFYQAEPDIWMIMVVEKTKDTDAIGRSDALQGVLKEVHSLFTMFFGSIRGLLEKQPGGGTARSLLYFFIMDYLAEFLVGKKLQMPCSRDCLRERGTVQMLTTGREAAIEVQSLVRLLESSCVANMSCHSLVLYHDLLVSTTLPPGDTANLFNYALLRLTPNALSSVTSSWSYLRKSSSGASQESVNPILANIGVPSEEVSHSSRDTSPNRQGQRHHVARPLQRGKWWRGEDGFAVTENWGSEIGNRIFYTPTVWLQQIEEHMHLCVYQHKSLTIILLISTSLLVNGEQGISFVKQLLLENASLKILKVEEKLSKEWGGENAYHVRGYRYLLLDNDSIVSRASPPGKVTTLSKGSLMAMSKLREEVDQEKRKAKRDDPDHEKDFEVCMRAKNNAWIVARVSRGKELYMVLEKASETLLFASEAVDKFSNRYCNGAFSLD